MYLAAKSLQIVHESIALVFGVFEMNADVNCLFRADFLTVSAEDATKFVYLVNERYAVALFILTGHEFDTVRRANLRTKPTCHALGFPLLIREHTMCAPPTR